MKKSNRNRLYTRYALTGGGLGLYFGLFFRPVREPNYLFALFLALLIAIVMTLLHFWQKRPSLTSLPAQFALTFIKATGVLLLLEGRHLAFDWGGKVAVILFTVLMGTLSGLWFAYEQMQQAGDKQS